MDEMSDPSMDEDSMEEDEDSGDESGSSVEEVSGDESGSDYESVDDEESTEEVNTSPIKRKQQQELLSSSSDEGNEKDRCPVCLNRFIGQDLGVPENCDHIFCFECIKEWSTNINTCPIDRNEFNFIHKKRFPEGKILKKVRVKINSKEPEEGALPEDNTLCEVCRLGDREHRLLLCDACDLAYHCDCLDPPLFSIPIEEWFCPPCSSVMDQIGNRARLPSVSRSRRVIPRTSASESVRVRVQNRRTNPSTSGQTSGTYSPRKRKRRAYRRSIKKVVKLARTKGSGGSGKGGKGERTSAVIVTYRKRYRRRKRRKLKRKSTRLPSKTAESNLQSAKDRIAKRLGICKGSKGSSVPDLKSKPGTSSQGSSRERSHSIFGVRDQLMDFSENFNEDLAGPSTSTSAIRNTPVRAQASTSSSLSFLDNILAGQELLHTKSDKVLIRSDGSIIRKEEEEEKKKSIKETSNPFKKIPNRSSSADKDMPSTSSRSVVRVGLPKPEKGKSVTFSQLHRALTKSKSSETHLNHQQKPGTSSRNREYRIQNVKKEKKHFKTDVQKSLDLPGKHSSSDLDKNKFKRKPIQIISSDSETETSDILSPTGSHSLSDIQIKSEENTENSSDIRLDILKKRASFLDKFNQKPVPPEKSDCLDINQTSSSSLATNCTSSKTNEIKIKEEPLSSDDEEIYSESLIGKPISDTFSSKTFKTEIQDSDSLTGNSDANSFSIPTKSTQVYIKEEVISSDEENISNNVKVHKIQIKAEPETPEKSKLNNLSRRQPLISWDDLPPTQMMQHFDDLPATQVMHPFDDLPSTQAATAFDDLPSTQAVQPFDDLPPTQMMQHFDDFPATQAINPFDDLPSTQAAKAFDDLPSTQAVQPFDDLPSTQAINPSDDLPPTQVVPSFNDVPSNKAKECFRKPKKQKVVRLEDLPCTQAFECFDDLPCTQIVGQLDDLSCTQVVDQFDDLPDTQAVDQFDDLPCTQAAECFDDLPCTQVVKESNDLPDTQVVDQFDDLPCTQAVEQFNDLPDTQAVGYFDDLLCTQAVDKFDNLPCTQLAECFDDLPCTQAMDQFDDLPCTQAVEQFNDLPDTQAVEQFDDLPDTQAVEHFDDLPDTQAVDQFDDLPCTQPATVSENLASMHSSKRNSSSNFSENDHNFKKPFPALSRNSTDSNMSDKESKLSSQSSSLDTSIDKECDSEISESNMNQEDKKDDTSLSDEEMIMKAKQEALLKSAKVKPPPRVVGVHRNLPQVISAPIRRPIVPRPINARTLSFEKLKQPNLEDSQLPAESNLPLSNNLSRSNLFNTSTVRSNNSSASSLDNNSDSVPDRKLIKSTSLNNIIQKDVPFTKVNSNNSTHPDSSYKGKFQSPSYNFEPNLKPFSAQCNKIPGTNMQNTPNQNLSGISKVAVPIAESNLERALRLKREMNAEALQQNAYKGGIQPLRNLNECSSANRNQNINPEMMRENLVQVPKIQKKKVKEMHDISMDLNINHRHQSNELMFGVGRVKQEPMDEDEACNEMNSVCVDKTLDRNKSNNSDIDKDDKNKSVKKKKSIDKEKFRDKHKKENSTSKIYDKYNEVDDGEENSFSKESKMQKKDKQDSKNSKHISNKKDNDKAHHSSTEKDSKHPDHKEKNSDRNNKNSEKDVRSKSSDKSNSSMDKKQTKRGSAFEDWSPCVKEHSSEKSKHVENDKHVKKDKDSGKKDKNGYEGQGCEKKDKSSKHKEYENKERSTHNKDRYDEKSKRKDKDNYAADKPKRSDKHSDNKHDQKKSIDSSSRTKHSEKDQNKHKSKNSSQKYSDDKIKSSEKDICKKRDYDRRYNSCEKDVRKKQRAEDLGESTDIYSDDNSKSTEKDQERNSDKDRKENRDKHFNRNKEGNYSKNRKDKEENFARSSDKTKKDEINKRDPNRDRKDNKESVSKSDRKSDHVEKNKHIKRRDSDRDGKDKESTSKHSCKKNEFTKLTNSAEDKKDKNTKHCTVNKIKNNDKDRRYKEDDSNRKNKHSKNENPCKDINSSRNNKHIENTFSNDKHSSNCRQNDEETPKLITHIKTEPIEHDSVDTHTDIFGKEDRVAATPEQLIDVSKIKKEPIFNESRKRLHESSDHNSNHSKKRKISVEIIHEKIGNPSTKCTSPDSTSGPEMIAVTVKTESPLDERIRNMMDNGEFDVDRISKKRRHESMCSEDTSGCVSDISQFSTEPVLKSEINPYSSPKTIKIEDTKNPSSNIRTEHKSSSELKEEIANQIKLILKPFYTVGVVNKEDYKDIMRKAVPKVFANCGNLINPEKIKKLVLCYVSKLKNT